MMSLLVPSFARRTCTAQALPRGSSLVRRSLLARGFSSTQEEAKQLEPVEQAVSVAAPEAARPSATSWGLGRPPVSRTTPTTVTTSKPQIETTQAAAPSQNRSTVQGVRPKASNPSFFRDRFAKDQVAQALQEAERIAVANREFQPTKAKATSIEQQVQQGGTIAHQLQAGGEKLPKSCWAQIDNIPPLSSLDAILAGVKKALDIEQERGIIDLDANWKPEEEDVIPFLPATDDDWVHTAKVILSPFGRPTGWNLKFKNRSVVHAILTHARETPIQCAWKKVGIKEVPGKLPEPNPAQAAISEATLRVENCPNETDPSSLVRFFSRFDLTITGPSVVQWLGQTLDGKKAPTTFLIHFEDAAWARAALREKQSAVLRGRTLRLAQYPRQIL